MKDYSQNGEQKIILDYFRDKYNGRFLDIGANDGITLSNVYALALKGWNGVMCEPSPKAFDVLKRNYKELPHIELLNIAIGAKSGRYILKESNSHLVRGDNNNISLLSTFEDSEVKRWKGTQVFTDVEVEVQTYKFAGLNLIDFDFISIDAEGWDFMILEQIDLTNVSMLCIEWNGNKDMRAQILEYCRKFNMKIEWECLENLILIKQ